jgi:hypothetical protein
VAENKIRIVIAADGSPAISGIKSVGGSLGEFENKSSKLTGFIRRHWLGIGAAVASTYLAIKNGMSVISESIALANAQEEAEKRLTVALGYRSQALIDQATAIQQMTTYEDDAVIAAQAMLAMFVKDESQIKKATEATLNLAAAKGMDLKNAADLVSKTLGSTTNALSRYGIQVEGAVGSNERLASTVDNINRVFGGQAAATADIYGGKVVMLKNAWGDLKEELGKAITENRFMIETTGILKSAIEDLSKWIVKNKETLMEMVKSAVLFAIEAFTLLIQIIDKAAAAWRYTKLSHTEFAETHLAMTNGIIASEQTATEAILKENQKKDESWKALLTRLENIREKIAAVKAEAAKPIAPPVPPPLPEEVEVAKAVPEWQKALDKAAFEEAKAYDDAIIEANQAWRKWELEQIRERIKEEQEAAERRLELERQIAGIKSEQARLLFDARAAEMERAFEALGGGEITTKVGILSAIQEGQDPYTQDYLRWQELQDQKILAMEEYGASESEIKDAYRQYDLQQEEMLQQQKLAMASATFGVLGGLAQSFYALSGNQNKAAFKAMQMFRIAETTIDTHKAAVAAYSALAGIPIVGPALGAAAAAAAIAFGMAQVRAIASMKPGGGVAGNASARIVSAGSASPGSPATPAGKEGEEKKASPVVNVHIYGNVVDHDAFARELVPSITKALGDNVQ